MQRVFGVAIRHPKRVLAVWVVLLIVGGAGASKLGSLVSNQFSVPGSEAQKGLDLLRKTFNERGDGSFTLVLQARQGTVRDPAFRQQATAAARRAASVVHGANAGPVQPASATVAYVQINTPLQNADAADKTPAMRRAIGHPPAVRTYLSGFPAVNHDTTPIANRDTARGESIAVPVAVLVLAFMFGTAAGIAVPLLFALASIPTTLGILWIFAHVMTVPVYTQQLVTLIGLAIAIDYSMLVVFRFREELNQREDVDEALDVTMATAGRATIFSGTTVAIGLALLVLMPLPFMRGMGMGGLLIPLVSIVASATLLPALLKTFGRSVNRFRVVPRRVLARRAAGEGGAWARLARAIMRRPWAFLIGSSAIMIALALPALGLHLTGGDNRGQPSGTEATDGLKLLTRALGPGPLAPNQFAIDTGRPGGATSPGVLAAERRLIVQLRRDPEIDPRTILAPSLVPPAEARRARIVSPDGRVMQIRVAGRHDAGEPPTISLVHRLRNTYVPRARFPAGTTVYVTGAPAFGVDFTHKAYSVFPWLVAGVLIISYFVLLRAFRSVLLPAKAVLMNLLSVTATFGVLTLVFEHDVGRHIGLQSSPQIEAWIPVFLFAILFGLSMDYEVFLLSRMREEWDRSHDNDHAVASGLEHTGRIITAAAVIMVAAFSGFIASSFVALQEFGIGLAAAIILDATVVRAILVPAAMKLLGHWNWWLPENVRRAMRLRAAPLVPGGGEPAAGTVARS